MGKVVTSKGLNEFISSGKTEEIKADPPEKPQDAPKLEVVQDKHVKDLSPPKVEDEEAPVDDNPDIADELAKSEKVRRAVNKYYRKMRQVQAGESKLKEDAAEAERFAENQYNRARLAEERAAQLERERDELRAKATPTPQPETEKEPDPSKYMDDKGQFKAFEYAKDLAAYSAKTAVENDRRSQAEAARVAAEQERFAKLKAVTDVFTKDHPDFFEALEKVADVKVRNEVLGFIAKRPAVANIQYYLATHRPELERISKLAPDEAIAEIRDIELTFEKPKQEQKTQVETPVVPPRAVSGAPAPIVPLEMSGTEGVVTDPSKMNFKQLRAYEKQRQAEKRKR